MTVLFRYYTAMLRRPRNPSTDIISTRTFDHVTCPRSLPTLKERYPQSDKLFRSHNASWLLLMLLAVASSSLPPSFIPPHTSNHIHFALDRNTIKPFVVYQVASFRTFV
jgi:hypothetical protein